MEHILKVVCINTGRVPNLTLNKIYDSFAFFDKYIEIINDSGRLKRYKKERFMKIFEYREMKLKEIGI